MTKRPHAWEVGLQRPLGVPQGDIGPLEHVKTDVARFGDKENSRISQDRRPSKFKNHTAANTNPRPILTKNKAVPTTRRPLKPKHSNALALRAAYPISEHIVKSNLYDDENWIGQQQVLFASILNEILETAAFDSTSWDNERLEKVRLASFEYFQSSSFQSIVHRLTTVPVHIILF